jgi:hypothetical protein
MGMVSLVVGTVHAAAHRLGHCVRVRRGPVGHAVVSMEAVDCQVLEPGGQVRIQDLIVPVSTMASSIYP